MRPIRTGIAIIYVVAVLWLTVGISVWMVARLLGGLR